jgi:hypothetical protein
MPKIFALPFGLLIIFISRILKGDFRRSFKYLINFLIKGFKKNSINNYLDEDLNKGLSQY